MPLDANPPRSAPAARYARLGIALSVSGPPTEVLFLDLDDVLIVPTRYRIKQRRRVMDGRKVHYAFCPDTVSPLFEILARRPACQIVLSSTWRTEGRERVADMFRLNRCGELLERFHTDWATPDLWSIGSRLTEIEDWLGRHPETDRHAALDDDPCIADQPWAVLIDPATGLTRGDAERAIGLLSP